MPSTTTTAVTCVLAKSTLVTIEGNMGSAFWKQMQTNGVGAQRCLERMREIAGSGQPHLTCDSDAADFLALID